MKSRNMLSTLSNKEIAFQTVTQPGASMILEDKNIDRLLIKVDEQYWLLRNEGFTDIYCLYAKYNTKTGDWRGQLLNYEAFSS
jgi:hypothetical protein